MIVVFFYIVVHYKKQKAANFISLTDRSIELAKWDPVNAQQNEIIIYFERRTKRSRTHDKIFNTIAGELFHSIQTRAISLAPPFAFQKWFRLILIDKNRIIM